MYLRASILGVLMITTGASAGCGGTTLTPADLASVDLAGPASRPCADPRADGWTLPVAKTSAHGSFSVSLVASTASPPVIGDTTSWTLLVERAVTSAPITGATITAKPWMPDHGHGTSVRAVISEGAVAGQYTVAPLYLFMAGLWQITFTIGDGTTTDEVVYSVCLADTL